jgi:general L-amino acid transport system permease protein
MVQWGLSMGGKGLAGKGIMVGHKSPLRWIRMQFFRTPLESAMTIILGCAFLWIVPGVLRWMILDATFFGTARSDCVGEGACWPFVWSRIGQFLYGFYPPAEIWRFGILVSIAMIWAFLFKASNGSIRRRWALLIAILVYPAFAWILLKGGVMGISPVETSQWGGLLLTLFISLCGIIWSLPLGILLALGRRSSKPVLQKLSVLFIEVWRGVPLITILFLSSVMFPLFLPRDMTVDKLMRAVVGVTLFASAYMAEVVRAGLNGVPKGQMEASYSLGLGWFQGMGLIVLPQALKIAIPGIVNTFIGLFKDTSLVLIIGMFDLLGMVQAASTDTEWLGCSIEGYVFAGILYWIFCFNMSRYSLRLESRLNREVSVQRPAHP